MSDDVTADPLTFGELDDGQPLLYGQRLLSSLYREIGLAAVAIELNLQLNVLEPDVAEAIERGAAALFHAGRRSRLIRQGRSVWAREKGSRHKVARRRWRSKARQSLPFPTGKPEIELRDKTEGVRAARIGP